MTIEDRTQKLQEIRNLSEDEIHEKLSDKVWNPETEEIAQRELQIREKRETLKSLANSTAANEKAAHASEKASKASEKTAAATLKLVWATWALVLITVYIGVVSPWLEKRRTADQYIKGLKHSFPSIRAEIQQNVRMIDANQEILAKNIPVLNGLYVLEKPNMDDVLKYVGDTGVIISVNNLRECLNMLNQKILERNGIYERSMPNQGATFMARVILPKEETIKNTAQNCLSSFERAQHGLDQIHTYIVDTEIK